MREMYRLHAGKAQLQAKRPSVSRTEQRKRSHTNDATRNFESDDYDSGFKKENDLNLEQNSIAEKDFEFQDQV